MSGPAGRLAALALGPLARVYGAVVRARNRRYDRPGAAERVGLPVLSVGNLVVGGTGKTPTVAWLAAHLVTRGQDPAIVSRGYGGRAGRGPILVSAGAGAGAECSPHLCGDEPFLLANAIPGAMVVVGADRVAAARLARAAGARTVVLDDGFQHRRLARDLDLVLLDAMQPFGNGRLLPAGTLREPSASLARADLILVTRADPGHDLVEIRRVAGARRPSAPIVPAAVAPAGLVDAAGRPAAPPPRAVAFCGIANPTRFRSDLERAGIEVVAFRAFRDHARLSDRAIAALRRTARETAARLVTTEKDLARLADRPDAFGDEPLLALRVELVVHDPRPLHEAVERALSRRVA